MNLSFYQIFLKKKNTKKNKSIIIQTSHEFNVTFKNNTLNIKKAISKKFLVSFIVKFFEDK